MKDIMTQGTNKVNILGKKVKIRTARITIAEQ